MSKMIIFQPSYSTSGSWVAGASPDSSEHQVETHPGEDALPWQGTPTPTHTHSGWDNSDKPVQFMYTSLGCGRKPESPKKTHTDMGRTYVNST